MTSRRSFPRTAALSTVAASSSPAAELLPARPKAARSFQTDARPFEADIADSGYAAHIANSNMTLFVRLEEFAPADPGELSGARLYISDRGTDTHVSASIGDNLQPGGHRTSHYLGWLSGEDTSSVALADPTAADEAFCLGFREGEGGPQDRILLMFSGAKAQMSIEIAGYCLGVLRGELLARFLTCVRRRRALKIGA